MANTQTTCQEGAESAPEASTGSAADVIAGSDPFPLVPAWRELDETGQKDLLLTLLHDLSVDDAIEVCADWAEESGYAGDLLEKLEERS